MGTVFHIQWTRLAHWPSDIEYLTHAGFTVAACTLAQDAVRLDDFARQPPERVALVLGSEGDGLSPSTIATADLSVRIPMTAGVDSLNVAAASAVLLWALRTTPHSASE